jgi:alpha-glucosidase
VESEALDETSPLLYYRKLARIREAGDAAGVLQQGDYTELLPDNPDVYAFRRRFGCRQTVTLANFSSYEVVYDAKKLAGAELLVSSQEGSAKGVLRPYEAVCYLMENAKGGEEK